MMAIESCTIWDVYSKSTPKEHFKLNDTHMFLKKKAAWPEMKTRNINQKSTNTEKNKKQTSEQKSLVFQDLELHLMVSSTSTRPSSATSTSTAASSATSTVRRSGYGNGNVVMAMANLTTSK